MAYLEYAQQRTVRNPARTAKGADKRMRAALAVDPGAAGGIAWTDSDGTTHAIPMPDGMTAQTDALRGIVAARPDITATMERTGGYMPGNSGPAACKFARHCGHIESALYCMGVPTTQVAPQTWQKHLGALPKDKPDRKRAIREAMARLYPTVSVTLKTADALAILTWRRSQWQTAPEAQKRPLNASRGLDA